MFMCESGGTVYSVHTTVCVYIDMTLVKSLYSGDPDVIRNTRTCKVSARQQTIHLASAIRPTSQCSSCVVMYDFVTHALEGAMSEAHMQMFRITINNLSGWLFSRLLASQAGGPGPIPGRDMSVLGPLDQDRYDSLYVVSLVLFLFLLFQVLKKLLKLLNS